MDLNRNQIFAIGLLLLLFGMQLRMVESFVFTPEFTQWLTQSTSEPFALASATLQTLSGKKATVPPKTVTPPEWLGWSMVSIGTVLILQSLAMRKPG